jgi:hypothetical protein
VEYHPIGIYEAAQNRKLGTKINALSTLVWSTTFRYCLVNNAIAIQKYEYRSETVVRYVALYLLEAITAFKAHAEHRRVDILRETLW